MWSNDDEVKLVTAQKSIPFAGNWKFAVEKIYAAINQNEFPSLIYNAMIHPIEDFKISGMLWYQGESNAERAYEYNQSFRLLINSWRQRFGENLPFYFVQLDTFNTKGDSNDDEVKLVTAQKSIPLAGNWKFAVEKIYAAINQNEFPSLIYNAMIHP